MIPKSKNKILWHRCVCTRLTNNGRQSARFSCQLQPVLAELLNRPGVERSTITVWSASPYTGVAEGELFFAGGFRLRMREELDFDERIITSYGYEAYKEAEKLYWYDDFPHPNDSSLASTHPHHKHVPPNIKRNRVPAPGIGFTAPNLPQIIQELNVSFFGWSRITRKLTLMHSDEQI